MHEYALGATPAIRLPPGQATDEDAGHASVNRMLALNPGPRPLLPPYGRRARLRAVPRGLAYLLAQRLPKRSPEPVTMRTSPRRQLVDRWVGIGWIVLVLLVIGLWAGIKSSNPQPQPAVQPVPTCPSGPMWAPLQRLCQEL